MTDYDGLDAALGMFQNTAFAAFVVSLIAVVVSSCLGGLFTELQVLGLVLTVIASALAMHYSGRLRVKLWMERIKKS